MKISNTNKVLAVVILGVLIYRGYQKTNSFVDAIAGILFVLNFLFSLIFTYPILKSIILNNFSKSSYKEYMMLLGIPLILNIGILICENFFYLQVSMAVTFFFYLLYFILIKFFRV